MLDRTAFRSLLSRTLNGNRRESVSAVELHLHGGESFFLCCVKRIARAYALCEVVPMHEYAGTRSQSTIDAAPGRTEIPVTEAAIPYATIASLAVSPRRLGAEHPVAFRPA